MSAPKILAVYESRNGNVTHYRLTFGRPGKPNVSVRIGNSGVYACLTCANSTTCEHVKAVRLPVSTPKAGAA